jgi:structural maintenance of chromosome 1
VEEAREATRKSQKSLDRVLKDIATWNDDVQRGSSERHAIYRRCRLEDIALPLVEGRLDKVSLEETEAMEVVEEASGTQAPVKSNDFGIVVDFEGLEEEDKGVS